MSASRIAIIIPHYDDHDRLGRCLAALAPQIGAGDEVVVVDNASPRRPHVPEGVRLVVEAEKGAAVARNRGVAETVAPVLLFLDCDCVPARDWLATARGLAERADLIGGTVTVFDESPPPRSGAEAFETVFAFDNRGYVERKGFSVTANLLTHRKVLDTIGGFRPGLSEDLEWCRRATAAGYRLVHEEAIRVAHPTRRDWPALEKKWRRLTEETWGLGRQDARGRALWAARALAMPLSIPAHAPRLLRHPDLAPREKARALSTLARLRLRRAGWMLAQAAGRGI